MGDDSVEFDHQSGAMLRAAIACWLAAVFLMAWHGWLARVYYLYIAQ